MPNLNQCKHCKDFQKDRNLCTRQWREIEFDGKMCNVQKDIPFSVFANRNDKSETIQLNEKEDGANDIYTEVKIVEVSSLTFKIMVVVATIVVVGLVSGLVYYLYDSHKTEERQLLIGEVNLVLDNIREDKTLGCISMFKYNFDGDRISVDYWLTSEPSGPLGLYKDSLETNFWYLASLNPEEWKIVKTYLGDRKTEIQVTFISSSTRDSVITNIEKTCNKLDDELFQQRAMHVFAQWKIQDIVEYTEKHFKKDGVLSLAGVRLEKNFVRLGLAFDDSHTKIGKAMLDSTRIDANFTDKVGERGSILHELFLICVHTHRGFTIEYLGTHNRTHHILSWNYDRVMEFKPLFKLGADPNQEENQVGVCIVEEKKK